MFSINFYTIAINNTIHRMSAMDSRVEDAVSGGLWIFVGSVTVSVVGFLFWFVLSRVVGVECVGVASAIVSAVSIASIVVSSGLDTAIVREVAAYGCRAFMSSIILSLLLGAIAVVILQPLLIGVGYGLYSLYASLLVFLSVVSLAVQSMFIGFEMFREIAVLLVAASIAKLVVGIGTAFIGLDVLAPLLGHLSHFLVVSLLGLALLLRDLKSFKGLSMSIARSIATLMLSNYPYAFSNQIPTMLSIYLFTLIVGKPISTGTLYIAFMIMLTLASIPNSLLRASLPIGTRRNTDPFDEAFRIGLALTVPLSVAIASAPSIVLRVINPELVEGSTVLEILSASLIPLTFLSMIITRFNKERNLRGIWLLGSVRISTLLILLTSLARAMDATGVALSYLLSTCIATLLSIPMNRDSARDMLIFWTISIIPISLYFLGISNSIAIAVTMFALSILLIHMFKVFRVEEYINVVRIALKSFRGDKH